MSLENITRKSSIGVAVRVIIVGGLLIFMPLAMGCGGGGGGGGSGTGTTQQVQGTVFNETYKSDAESRQADSLPIEQNFPDSVEIDSTELNKYKVFFPPVSNTRKAIDYILGGDPSTDQPYTPKNVVVTADSICFPVTTGNMGWNYDGTHIPANTQRYVRIPITPENAESLKKTKAFVDGVKTYVIIDGVNVDISLTNIIDGVYQKKVAPYDFGNDENLSETNVDFYNEEEDVYGVWEENASEELKNASPSVFPPIVIVPQSTPTEEIPGKVQEEYDAFINAVGGLAKASGKGPDPKSGQSHGDYRDLFNKETKTVNGVETITYRLK